MARWNRAPDLSGQRFGRLIVLRRGQDKQYRRSKQAVWVCRCDCGAIKYVTALSLKKGGTQSCGCLHDSLIEARGRATQLKPKHGLSRTREYRSWVSMISRCTDSQNQDWADYGGRGITVCPSWLASPAQFVADMGACPAGHTLDRIDNNRGYGPENCRWSDAKAQSRNRRSNVLHEYRGKMRCIAEIAEMAGVSQRDLYPRIALLGMPVELAIEYTKWRRQRAEIIRKKKGRH